MKYTNEITINKPRAELVKKLEDPQNLKFWQRDFRRYRLISGTPGREGARMELYYKIGKRKIVMIETIMKRNPPYEYHTIYEARGLQNIQKNYFKDVDEHTTKWIAENEFQFTGFMFKLMGFLMPGALKGRSLRYLKDFKAFVEEGISVGNSD